MSTLNIRKGDTVMVITGKDKGKSGKVLKVQTEAGRIYVEGVNIVSKSKKPRNAQDNGGILKQEGTIDVSNVMVVCPTCGAVTKVKHNVVDVNGKQKSVRVCAKCGAQLDAKKAAKKTAKKSTKKKVEKSEEKAD